jgi:hypothetical protein
MHGKSMTVATVGKPNMRTSRRPRLPPFRGMWRSSTGRPNRSAAYAKTKCCDEGHLDKPASKIFGLSEAPQAAVQPVKPDPAPASRPISLSAERPHQQLHLESMIDALCNLETASASGSQSARRRSNTVHGLAEQTFPRVTTPRVFSDVSMEAKVPETPRLGLRPPWSAPSSPSEAEAIARRRSELVATFGQSIDTRAEHAERLRPEKPKIAGMWGARRRRLLEIEDIVRAPSRQSRTGKEEADLEATHNKIERPRLTRPRPACRPDRNFEHTVLLRPNEFTTSTNPYRTYGPQWVLTKSNKNRHQSQRASSQRG